MTPLFPVDEHSKKDSVFDIARFFSFAALLCILLSAIALTFLNRQTSIRVIIETGEDKNIVIAQTLLNSIRLDLLAFLNDAKGKEKPSLFTSNLRNTLRRTTQNTSVVRVKIYNQHSKVVYSTKEQQIGDDASLNQAYLAAMQDRITSKLLYRDTFNIFDQATEEDNLIQTYIPIYRHSRESAIGVLEIYTDVDTLVENIERSVIIAVAGVAAILATLYYLLLLIVRRADRIIKKQKNTIVARNDMLELLSAQLLTAEERERKKVSHELHEGIAQTLSAIKLQLENSCAGADSEGRIPYSTLQESIVPQMRLAIQDVRTMAMDLRPPSLDDLGLAATVGWLSREYESIYPRLKINVAFKGTENNIPAPLKIIIFRVAKKILSGICTSTEADEISLAIDVSSSAIHLTIEDNAIAFYSDNVTEVDIQTSQTDISSARERTILSGGAFKISTNKQGGSLYESQWRYLA